MKVYIATTGSYSDYQIEAVFTDEGKAKAYVDYWNSLGGDYDLEEYDTDKNWEKASWIVVYMEKDGTCNVYKCDEPKNGVEYFEFDHIPFRNTGNRIKCTIKTSSPERAIKITNEYRTFALANDCWDDIDKMGKLMGREVKEYY